MADLRCYLQVKVESKQLASGSWKVEKARAINMTQYAPSTLSEGATHVVECKLTIPDQLLLPIQAEATIPELRLRAEYEAAMKELES